MGSNFCSYFLVIGLLIRGVLVVGWGVGGRSWGRYGVMIIMIVVDVYMYICMDVYIYVNKCVEDLLSWSCHAMSMDFNRFIYLRIFTN